MMEVTCSTNSVCEDIGCGSNLPSFDCKESNTEDQQQYACITIKDSAAIEIQEVCNHCSEVKEVSSIDPVVRLPANGVRLQDSHARSSEFDATSDEDDVANSVGISNNMESGLFVSFDGSVGLSKSVAFPSSELELSHSLCAEEIAASPTYKHSVFLPASSNLVSAMKGGRAQNGIALASGLHVKWALDVYDPAPTSCKLQTTTTTQGNNHQRLKSKRKDKHKQKHPKAKASRFSKGKNKQSKEHS